jgi:hypothetical protein
MQRILPLTYGHETTLRVLPRSDDLLRVWVIRIVDNFNTKPPGELSRGVDVLLL